MIEHCASQGDKDCAKAYGDLNCSVANIATAEKCVKNRIKAARGASRDRGTVGHAEQAKKARPQAQNQTLPIASQNEKK